MKESSPVPFAMSITRPMTSSVVDIGPGLLLRAILFVGEVLLGAGVLLKGVEVKELPAPLVEDPPGARGPGTPEADGQVATVVVSGPQDVCEADDPLPLREDDFWWALREIVVS